MVVPVISDLPPAPTRSDGAANFTPKSDAMIGALQPLVVQVNIAIQWMNGTLTATQAARDAAAASADAAANSANLAGQKLGLATTQANNAAASANSAQVAAVAAGAAAGLPSLVGHGGQPLCAKLDETGVEFKSVGQAVGDTLITNRPAPVGYVEAGAIYTQASYPELFALLGIKEANNDGANWGAYTATPASTVDFMVSGKDDVIICVANTASSSSTGGRAFRSTDSGATWVSVAGLLGKESLGTLACDMSGNWIVTTQLNQQNMYTSNDNGVTWTQRARVVSSNTAIQSVVSGQTGVFVMCTYTTTPSVVLHRSTDYGVTWTPGVQYDSYSVQASPVTDGNGFWLMGLSLGANLLSLQSYDNFVTGYVGNGLVNPRAGGYGVVMASISGVVTAITDAGLTSTQSNGIPAGTIFIDKSGIMYVFDGSTTGATFAVFKSYDRGYSWSKGAVALGIGTLPSYSTVALSNGTWISCYNSAWRKSTRLYNYDTATLFKVPAIKVPYGFKAYVKAKAA